MKNVLVLIHDDAGQEARFQAALDAARAISGHLTCLDVCVMRVLPGDGFGSDAGLALLEYERTQEAANKARLEQRLAAEDVPWNWIDTCGFLQNCLEDAAPLADLIVVNRRLDAVPFPDEDRAAAAVIARSGKPVLAVPDKARGFDTGGTALVAWNGSDSSAAALAAAVPLLKAAAGVKILEIGDGTIRAPAEEAAAYLSRHGIHPRIEREPAAGRSSADILLERAGSGAYAWIVMGGYGHSRLREALFGGTTRRLLEESPIPLFLAH